MTDEELAEYLHFPQAEALIIIPKLTPSQRAIYSRMRQFQKEAELWAAGLGPKPKGGLIEVPRCPGRRSPRGREGLVR